MMSNSTKISLAIPVYNGENYISEAIGSILAQTHSNIELIITDNASIDDTRRICLDYARKDTRIRYYRNDSNLGAAANLNLGFSYATGRYFKWCAHDDRISPDYVELCVAALDADPNVALAFGATVCVDGHREYLPAIGEESPSLMESEPSERFMKAIRLAGACFHYSGVFRTATLARSTLNRPYFGSDRALLAEIALLGRFLRVEQAIFYNREHSGRSVRIDDKLARSAFHSGKTDSKKAAEHINLTYHLLEIGMRHPDVLPPSTVISRLLPHLLRPRQLARYGLEVTSMLSPKTAQWLKSQVTRGPA